MENKEMRAAYTDALIALAAEDPRIVVLEADLMSSTGTKPFHKAYPDRLINVGVAEANMVGIAAGLSAVGKIPFAATFACFASRRAYDQFFISANYAGLNVKLVGSDPGITAAFNGGTHMPFEDLALMRVIPGLKVVEPSDPRSMEAFTRLAAHDQGCVYLRMHRKPMPYLYPEGTEFAWGKAKLLREGADALIVALGAVMVNEALAAATDLAAEGIQTAVIDALSLKPLDAELILEQARKTGRVLSCENHQVIGGLGSALAETLAEAGFGGKFARIGVQDLFGEVGTKEWLQERFKMTKADIIAAVKAML